MTDIYDKTTCGNTECKVTTNLKSCQNCKMIKYCSKSCQKTHWIAHKSLCKIITILNLKKENITEEYNLLMSNTEYLIRSIPKTVVTQTINSVTSDDKLKKAVMFRYDNGTYDFINSDDNKEEWKKINLSLIDDIECERQRLIVIELSDKTLVTTLCDCSEHMDELHYFYFVYKL